MTHVIAVHPLYKDVWPTAAEALRDLWLEEDEPVEFVELDSDDDQPIGIVLENAEIDDLSRIVSLGIPVIWGVSRRSGDSRGSRHYD